MRLNGLCKGLLEIDKHDEVQFIHRTVRDWLMSGPMETYLKRKTRANWDGTVSLLQCHLGWYKCPTSENLVSEPLISALSYGNRICEYKEGNGTNTVKKILDDFLAVTMELDSLGFHLARLDKDRPLESGSTVSLIPFKARLFESGLWDYLSLKLDEDPRFLDVLARLPLPMDIDPDTCLDPWSEREAGVRSKVAASFQASFLRQITSGSTTDVVTCILELECKQAEAISMILRSLLHMGSVPDPSPALIWLQSHGWPGFVVRLLLTDHDGADLSRWRSYFMTLLVSDRYIEVWDLLCKGVKDIRNWPETDSITAAADFLRFTISSRLRAGHTCMWLASGWPWVKLHTAIQDGFSGKCDFESKSLRMMLEQNGLVGSNPHDARFPLGRLAVGS